MDSNINKVQLAGTLVGSPREIHLEFNIIARQLRSGGFDVWTPSELHERNTSPFNRNNCLKKGIRSLMDRDALVMVKLEQPVPDAELLKTLASELGIEVLSWESLKRHLIKLRKGSKL